MVKVKTLTSSKKLYGLVESGYTIEKNLLTPFPKAPSLTYQQKQQATVCYRQYHATLQKENSSACSSTASGISHWSGTIIGIGYINSFWGLSRDLAIKQFEKLVDLDKTK